MNHCTPSTLGPALPYETLTRGNAAGYQLILKKASHAFQCDKLKVIFNDRVFMVECGTFHQIHSHCEKFFLTSRENIRKLA